MFWVYWSGLCMRSAHRGVPESEKRYDSRWTLSFRWHRDVLFLSIYIFTHFVFRASLRPFLFHPDHYTLHLFKCLCGFACPFFQYLLASRHPSGVLESQASLIFLVIICVFSFFLLFVFFFFFFLLYKPILLL